MLLFAMLAGCEEQLYDNSANTAPIPNAVNTAGLNPSLTITYPQGNAEDSSAFIQVAENSPTVAQVKAQDVAGSKLIYRLQDGEDMNRFVMDENTGALSFKELPDWENPYDADSNNNYMVLWQVLSSTGEARSQFLVIQVTDLPD
ncbi:MAG: cadherin repeat domain-containing protein [Phormidesmis sp.]